MIFRVYFMLSTATR